jgi:hypothetical protein
MVGFSAFLRQAALPACGTSKKSGNSPTMPLEMANYRPYN